MRKIFHELFSVGTGVAIGLLVLPHAAVATASAPAPTSSRELERLVIAIERIRENHVEEIDQARLVDAAIKGMIAALDRHAVYIEARTFRDLQISGRGWGGLGIESIMENGLVKIIAPIDDSPAARAGIRPGDVITHLDDVPAQGLTLYQALEKMRGPVNTTVRLRIVRKGEDRPFEMTIVRDTIRMRSVRTRKAGEDIGYIRIASFNEQTATLMKAIGELSSEISADKLKGYVLDLRNNPGGLLDQAISVADAFLDDGEIVSVRGRNPDQVERFNARTGDAANGKPIIVLINGGSARPPKS